MNSLMLVFSSPTPALVLLAVSIYFVSPLSVLTNHPFHDPLGNFSGSHPRLPTLLWGCLEQLPSDVGSDGSDNIDNENEHVLSLR